MARQGITFHQVEEAINTIIASGETPTIQKIRIFLGTGSPNTIHRHLTTWRDAAPVQERKAPELPADLQAAIVREFERQSAEARGDIEKLLVSVQGESLELSNAGEQLEQENLELSEANQTLNDEVKRLIGQLAEREREIGKLEVDLTREKETAENVRLELAKSLNKTEGQVEQIGKLEAKSANLKSRLGEVTDIKIVAEKSEAVMAAKFESAEGQLFESKKEIKRLFQELPRVQKEAKDGAQKIAHLDKELAIVNGKFETQGQELISVQKELAVAQREQNPSLTTKKV